MLTQQRRAAILAEIDSGRGIRVTETAARFGVSTVTIRRDLDFLSLRGGVERVYGGAFAQHAPTPTPTVAAAAAAVAERARAAAAAALAAPGMNIALVGTEETACLAAALLSVPGLTVVTNSREAADLFHAAAPHRRNVVLTGGARERPGGPLVGPLVAGALRGLTVDLLFVGCTGLDAGGAGVGDLAEAETNAAFVRAARRTVVLADRGRLGEPSFARFATPDQIDTLVTDAAPAAGARYRERLTGLAGNVLLAAG
ncbi:DeoR/GlpR family DNA-binding transcription regulator [Streptacidiphilus sp. PAMC 29251]